MSPALFSLLVMLPSVIWLVVAMLELVVCCVSVALLYAVRLPYVGPLYADVDCIGLVAVDAAELGSAAVVSSDVATVMVSLCDHVFVDGFMLAVDVDC